MNHRRKRKNRNTNFLDGKNFLLFVIAVLILSQQRKEDSDGKQNFK
jgi:hypothetical protein